MTDRTAPAKEARSEPLVTDERLELIIRTEQTLFTRGVTKRDPERLAMARELLSRRSSPVREGDLGQATPKTAPHPSRAVSLTAFAKDALQEFWSRDSADMQDFGIKHGLLIEVAYDPETHGEVEDSQRGDLIYIYSGWFKEAIAAMKAESAATHEMGAERSGASPSLSPSEPSGRGESGGILPTASEASMNKSVLRALRHAKDVHEGGITDMSLLKMAVERKDPVDEILLRIRLHAQNLQYAELAAESALACSSEPISAGSMPNDSLKSPPTVG